MIVLKPKKPGLPVYKVTLAENCPKDYCGRARDQNHRDVQKPESEDLSGFHWKGNPYMRGASS